MPRGPAGLPDHLCSHHLRLRLPASLLLLLLQLVVGLDKKEALLLQLRGMNDEAAAGVHGGAGATAAPPFVNAYASVVLQLKDVSGLQAGAGGCAAALQHQQLGASLAADAALQRQLQPLRLQPPEPPAQTAEAFSAAALEQAHGIIATCRRKLAESALAEEREAADAGLAPPVPSPDAAQGGAADGAAVQQQEQEQAQGGGAEAAAAAPAPAAAPLDWGSGEGLRLGGLIVGCVHSLVLLLRGAQSGGGLPPAALPAALDAALRAVAPHSAANQQLFREIEEAMRGLQQQISAS